MRFIFLIFLVSTIHCFGQGIENHLEKQYTKAIKQLVNKKQLKNAFQIIKELEPKTQERLIALTEIEAPPFKETNRAIEFAGRIKALGIDRVWIDAEGNVLGFLNGSYGRRTIAIDAHLDTVFPEGTDVRVRIKNDTLHAPGIGDDTRGLAMLLTLLETINTAKIKPVDNILFVGSVGEEGLGDLRGVKYLFRDDGPQINTWISIDGGSIGRINNKALGSYRYKVTYEGPGGHSWGAFGLANPHHALGEAISRFVKTADSYTATGPKTSYNVGVISGGTSINSIPFESSMEIDIRSIDPSRLDVMEGLLKTATMQALEAQNTLKRKGPDLTLDFKKIGNRPSGELSESLPLIQRALAATEYFEITPRLTRGSTNANIPISLGIPAITIGRGGQGENAHSLNEWWVNEEGHKAIQLALLILLSEAGIE